MAKRTFPLSRVYRLLESGPVVMLTTAGTRWPNIMTMSWHTMIDFDPPLVGCVVGERSFTFRALESTGECVINIPTVDLAREAVGCGNTSGRAIDKFGTFGLTPRPASRVRAPLIDECYASLECRVVDAAMVPKYDLFVLEVLKAWVDRSVGRARTIHHLGGADFMVAGRTIRLPSKAK